MRSWLGFQSLGSGSWGAADFSNIAMNALLGLGATKADARETLPTLEEAIIPQQVTHCCSRLLFAGISLLLQLTAFLSEA